MAIARLIMAVIIFSSFMMLGASAVSEAFEDSGQAVDISGESINTGGIGTVEELEQSKIGAAFYTDRPEITNSSGVLMSRPDDYIWNQNNGTFTVNSSAMANENGVTVDYGYNIPNQHQPEFATDFGNSFDAIAPLVIMFLVVAAIIGAMVKLGGVS